VDLPPWRNQEWKMVPNKRKTTWLVIGITGGVLILCLLIGCGALIMSAPRIYNYLLSRTALNVGSPAPDFKLTALTGEQVRLSQYQGQPVLPSFGATWCPDCNLADPVLQLTYDDHPELVVLLVDISETTATVQEWADENGYTFPVLLDSNGAAGNRYGIVAIPTVFFIDEAGVIQAKLIEAVTPELLADTLPLIGIEP